MSLVGGQVWQVNNSDARAVCDTLHKGGKCVAQWIQIPERQMM